MSPYCEHPECHDTSTAYYAWKAENGNAPWPLTRRRVSMVYGAKPAAWPYRRLCSIHARQEFRVSFGGRRFVRSDQ